MHELTVNALSELTELSRRTVKARLKGLDPIRVEQQGKREIRYYRTADALRAIFAPEASDGLSFERSRLARAQAERAETDNAIRRREYLPVEEVLLEVGIALEAAKRRLLRIPWEIAEGLAGKNPIAIRRSLEDAIRDALTELSEAPDELIEGLL